jgi:hypothetical protein
VRLVSKLDDREAARVSATFTPARVRLRSGSREVIRFTWFRICILTGWVESSRVVQPAQKRAVCSVIPSPRIRIRRFIASRVRPESSSTRFRWHVAASREDLLEFRIRDASGRVVARDVALLGKSRIFKSPRSVDLRPTGHGLKHEKPTAIGTATKRLWPLGVERPKITLKPLLCWCREGGSNPHDPKIGGF